MKFLHLFMQNKRNCIYHLTHMTILNFSKEICSQQESQEWKPRNKLKKKQNVGQICMCVWDSDAFVDGLSYAGYSEMIHTDIHTYALYVAFVYLFCIYLFKQINKKWRNSKKKWQENSRNMKSWSANRKSLDRCGKWTVEVECHSCNERMYVCMYIYISAYLC